MECVHENSTVPDLFVWKWGKLTGIVPTARAEAACKTMHLNGKVTFLFQKENSMTSLYFPNLGCRKTERSELGYGYLPVYHKDTQQHCNIQLQTNIQP